MQEDIYLRMEAPLTAVYPLDVPENTTIIGVPEIHVWYSCDTVAYDGLMVTAFLVDVSDQGEFPAYRIHTDGRGLVPRQETGEQLVIGGRSGERQSDLPRPGADQCEARLPRLDGSAES